MDIKNHPIWTQITPYNTKIASYKKPLHLLKFFLAKQYAKFFPKEIFIGITGSVGKTTTARACVKVLSQKYKTISTKSSLDPILNIPSTILSIKPSTQKVVLEMGIEYKSEMDFYLSLVQPKTAIFTEIYFAHSQFLGNVEEIIEEKGKLIQQIPSDGTAILNWDDPYGKKLADKCRGTVVFYGTDPNNCMVWAGNIRIENMKTVFEINHGVERIMVEYPLLGEHQIYTALAAATLGLVNGVPLTRVKIGLESLEPEIHRMDPLYGPNGSIILDDTYNSSPLAVEAAIDTLVKISGRRRIVVLGEMKELGKYSEKLHRQIAQKLYKEKIDMVLLGTGDTKFIADELASLGFWPDRIESDLQNSQIVSKLLKVLGKGDIVLIKGSRGVRLDEVVKRIEKRN